jgi:hypothetical protein
VAAHPEKSNLVEVAAGAGVDDHALRRDVLYCARIYAEAALACLAQ